MPSWDLVELLPALARGRVEQGVGGRVVGDAAGGGVELEPAAEALRDHAELAKEVLWAGMGRTAELWSKERWEAAQAMTEAELQGFKTAIAEQFRL